MTYVLVLALVVITFIARSQIAPTLGTQSLYLFLMPAVLFAGIIGGLGPGLLATFLCLALHLYATGEYVNLTNVDSPLFKVESTRAVTFVLFGVKSLGLVSDSSKFARWRMTARVPHWLARLMSNRSWTPFQMPWWYSTTAG